jgi:hypothetical protein
MAWHAISALARGIVGAVTNQNRPIALANKIARMAWAMMVKGEHYKAPVAPDNRRDVKLGRANRRCRAGLTPMHSRTRAFDRDLIRGGHCGQRSCEPRPKAEHTAALTNLQREKSPCQLGTVHTGG